MESDTKPPTRTEGILKFTWIVAGAAFIGYSIKAGSVLLFFIVSLNNPEAAKNLYYTNQDLFALRELGIEQFSFATSFILAMYALQSYVWFLMVKILSKIKISNPFTLEVANQMEKMSYYLASIAGIGVLASNYSEWLLKRSGESFMTWNTTEYIFMAGLVFIISQIFKRGIEIQSENELTV